MGFYRNLLRPVLFRADPERVHDLAVRACAVAGAVGPLRAALRVACGFRDPRLEVEVAGIRFLNPVGLAAGYDKNGRAVRVMEAMGFGHVEVGSVSAVPSEGNPRPRLWRLPEDEALCVHYGLPNEGAAAIAARLARTPRTIPLGVNVVKTNRGLDAPPDSVEAIRDDYVRSVRGLHDCADYLCLNLSCPNTEMGRDHFCEVANVRRLLEGLAALDLKRPVFLKVSPLGGVAALEGLLEAVEGFGFVSGFSFNLPPGVPGGVRSPVGGLRGAVSGRPVAALIDAQVGEMYRRMDRCRYRIIAAGGVFSAEDAYRKIRRGASLVQVFTGLVYEGPGLVRRINEGLCERLEREGLSCVGEAVGTAESGAG